jgi:UDP-N-acetylmuramate--alanine ligase
MVKTILFLGVGGIGMSSLTKYVLYKGYRVFGYDKNYSRIVQNLERLGMIFIDEGKIVKNDFLKNIDLIVRSSAISKDADILKTAINLKKPIIKRSKLLGQICSFGHQICLAGTHGKTTTTSMTAMIFKEAKLYPTVFVGGEVENFGGNFLKGEDKIFVVEADEYDRSFFDLNPLIVGVSNIEEDHLDIYENLHEIKSAFQKFIGKIPFYGTLILPYEIYLSEFKQNIICNVESFGLSVKADWHPENLEKDEFSVKFDVFYMGKYYEKIQLNTIGKHNILNAILAIAVTHSYKINKISIKSALAKFKGVKRRLQKLGVKKGVLFLDDYAHHPSEILATLSALKTNFKNRIIVIFQPHLYSRTRDFFRDFAKSLSIADYIILTEIYPAREKPIKNVNSKLIADLITKEVVSVNNKNHLFQIMSKTVVKNDIVIGLGAGTISNWMKEFYERY